MHIFNQFLEFIESNPQTASVFANGLLFLVTLSLAIITWRYTSHTKKMADIMMKDHELKIKPLFEIGLQDGMYKEENFERTIIINNQGLNTIYIKNIVSYIRVQNQSGQLIQHTFKEYSNSDKLEPSGSIHYKIHIDFKKLNELPIKNLFTDNDPNRVEEIFHSKGVKTELSPNLKYPNFDIICSLDIAGPDLNFKTYTKLLL